MVAPGGPTAKTRVALRHLPAGGQQRLPLDGQPILTVVAGVEPLTTRAVSLGPTEGRNLGESAQMKTF